jgi:hypothetical protein
MSDHISEDVQLAVEYRGRMATILSGKVYAQDRAHLLLSGDGRRRKRAPDDGALDPLVL